MQIRNVTLAGLTLIALPVLAQDASYQSTTQITGGTLVDTMKQISFMKSVKEMLAPTTSLTMVHGNQKAVVSKDSTEIIDLDKGAIYRLDNVKKTYTVTTFAQMRQMFAQMPAQMQKTQEQLKQAQAQQAQAQAQAAATPGAENGQLPPNMKMTYDVEAKNTGETKVINGQTAQEQVVTMSMHITDTNSPLAPGTNPMTYNMTTDVWIAPEPPEMKAIDDFNLRMGQKMMEGVDVKAVAAEFQDMRKQSQQMTAPLFAGQPGAAEAMKKMGDELAKIKGTRIMSTTSMGGIAPAGAAGTASAPPPPTGSSVATQVATDTATQTASGESSKLGVFGNALSSSALGAFKKKKATPPPAAPAAAAAPAAPADPSVPPGMQRVVLMATTDQLSNFSTEPVPTSVFQIPAGFKQVQQPAYPTK